MTDTRRLPPPLSLPPATFRERGVAVPFTTPLLAASRVRGAVKGPPELIIPSLSGNAGVYIMGWKSVAAIFPPTVHDRALYDRIRMLPDLTPAALRRVSREVAALGLAGEDAMDAANLAATEEKADRLVANYALLLTLIEQIHPGQGQSGGAAALSGAEVAVRGRLAVSKIAPALGRTTVWVAAALEEITDVLAGAGINLTQATSRRSRVVEQLRSSAQEIARWSQTQRFEDDGSYPDLICETAEFVLKLAGAIRDQARAMSKDVVGLLRVWAGDPAPVLRQIGRLDWLLDGWDQVCVVWSLAKSDAQRRGALAEIAPLVPVVPREVRDWTDICREADIPSQLRQLIPIREDWRIGAAANDLIARNEQIRAALC